jgi:Fic family protein
VSLSNHIFLEFEANILYIPFMTQIWQANVWPNFDYDRAAAESYLTAAIEALGEVSGLQAGLDPSDLEELRLAQVVQEAMSSFGIEGVTLDAAEIEASVIASLKHRNRAAVTRRSDAIVELMLAARRATEPLTAAILWGWHRLLFYGIEVEDIGVWRRFDIEIVSSAVAGNSEVLYKAPPPDRVDAEMAVFLKWIAKNHTLPTPIVAAIAHLWFESIHPFSDGNGRIGRAVIEHVFAKTKALPFSFSRQVEKDKKAYYAALQAGRREGDGVIDATAFVVWFLECLVRAATLSRNEAFSIVRRKRFLSKFSPAFSERQLSVLQTLFAQGETRIAQGISARSYCKIAKVSGPTATRDLAALERAGAVTRSEAGGRSTFYRINC